MIQHELARRVILRINRLALATLICVSTTSAAYAVTAEWIEDPDGSGLVAPYWQWLDNGSEFDFSTTPVGISKTLTFEFVLGWINRVEGDMYVDGPNFNIKYDSLDAFDFRSPVCQDSGFGFQCHVEAVFIPDAVGELSAEFQAEIHGRYTEIHVWPEVEQGFSDSLEVTFSGQGVEADDGETVPSPVPLPAGGIMLLAAIGTLGGLGLRWCKPPA